MLERKWRSVSSMVLSYMAACEGVLVLVFFLGSRQWRKLWWRGLGKF